ncbi:MAG: ribokinase [Pseudomonadota bacterium]
MAAAEPQRAPITVIGSANADYVMRVAELPAAGETVLGRDFDIYRGGKGANQAVACARLGARTRFVGCVGDDAAGRDARAAMIADGIDCMHLYNSDTHTGTALIFVNDAGENSIGVASGANARLSVERIETIAPMIADSAWLLMQLETPVDSVVAAATIAHDAGVPVALNPAPAGRPLPPSIWSRLSIVTPNETELATLTDHSVATEQDIVTAANRLREFGADTVIVTMGSAGAMIVSNSGVEKVSTETVTAVDTVGAGDTFNGALLVALSERQSLPDAVRFANAAAAIAVTRRGAQSAIPYRHELS